MFEAIFELDSDTNQVELIRYVKKFILSILIKIFFFLNRIEENDNGSDVPSYYAQQAAVNRKVCFIPFIPFFLFILIQSIQ